MSHIKHTLSNMQIKLFELSLIILCILFVTTPAQIAKGGTKFLGNLSTLGSIRTDFITYWNHITPENECKWSSVEGVRDQMTWGGGDKVANYARTNGIEWTFYNLFMGGSYPGWMVSIPQDSMYTEVKEWFDAAAARFSDVKMVNVINDAYDLSIRISPWSSALGGKGATGYDWIINAFKMARERWPEAILFLNDYNNIENDDRVNWTINLIDTLKKYNTPIDAIGCQAHDVYKISTSKVKANIDKLATTGLPIYISEYDIDQYVDSLQKNIMEEQFPMLWNHPKIIGITYYGYIMGKTWRPYTGLMSSDGIERPALTWLKNFVKNNPNPPNDFNTTKIESGYRIVQQGNHKSSSPVTDLPVKRFFNLQGRLQSYDGNSGSVYFSITPTNKPRTLYQNSLSISRHLE